MIPAQETSPSDETSLRYAGWRVVLACFLMALFLFGFGNLARRSERHFGMTVDIGAVYQGVPRTTLNFTGGACDPTGLGCRDVSSDPTVQSNIQSEQAKINHSASPLRFYPVISVGFGYKF